MPYTPGEETGKKNREWLFAEYAMNPDGSRTKVPGTGIEIDRKSRSEIPNRGRNRPDQRYSLPIEEIIARRTARALDEVDESLAVRMDEGRVEVVSRSENRYDVSGPDQADYCACPDFERLQLSYPDEHTVCKHILIARLKEAALDPMPLPVGVLWVAEKLGVDYKTVQEACRNGLCPATKQKRTWVIDPADADAFITAYREKMYDPDFLDWFNGIVPLLLTGRSGG